MVEWEQLINELGGKDADPFSKLTKKTDWSNGYNSINYSGFSALPGGKCTIFGKFLKLGKAGYWWSSNDKSCDVRYGSIFTLGTSEIFQGAGDRSIETIDLSDGFSVRCLKN